MVSFGFRIVSVVDPVLPCEASTFSQSLCHMGKLTSDVYSEVCKGKVCRFSTRSVSSQCVQMNHVCLTPVAPAPRAPYSFAGRAKVRTFAG